MCVCVIYHVSEVYMIMGYISYKCGYNVIHYTKL